MTDPMKTISEFASECQVQLQPASSVVADALRKAIISGSLAADSRLSQDEVAKLFGVSRMPVREAIRQLQTEGFIQYFPRRGAVVAQLSSEEVWEIDQTRLALETFALRESIPHLTSDGLASAKSILDRMDEDVDIQEWIELNTSFHLRLYSNQVSKRLMSLIALQYSAIARYANTHLRTLDYRARSQKEHRTLLRLVRAKEIGPSLDCLAKHIVEGSSQLASFLTGVRSNTSNASPQ